MGKKIIKTIFFLFMLIIAFFIGMRLGKVCYINNIYAKGMEYDDSVKQAKYVDRAEGYVYRFSKAKIFGNDCFVSISDETAERINITEDGRMYTEGLNIILYIWPEKHKMGLYLLQMDETIQINEQVYIDNELKCISDDSEYCSYINKILDENKERIQILLSNATLRWK